MFGAGRQNHVTIENSDDRDVLQLAVGITADQIWASRVGNDLELGTYGTGSTAIFADWYGDPQHALSRFQMSDGTALMAAQVQGLVQAMASFSAPASTSLPSIGPMHSLMNQAVLPTVANNTWGI